jgi:hypothetical protein
VPIVCRFPYRGSYQFAAAVGDLSVGLSSVGNAILMFLMHHRIVAWSLIAVCIATAATAVLWRTRIYEQQATLQDMEADLRSARASTRRYNTALSAMMRHADRLRIHTNPAVRSMELAIQQRRDEALLRELNEQVNYKFAAFRSDDLVVLTNYTIVAEATNAMMRLSRAGIMTEIRYVDVGSGKLPRSCHLVVRQVDKFRARQAMTSVLAVDGGADHQE